MSLESSVRECGASLGSTRASDRKKNGENLKNFLLGNAVPPMLTENTLRNKGYSWIDLFDDINELVMKETEKYESSKNFDTVAGPLCANLLQLCVSGSIKGKAYIRCDKVIDACLFILKEKRLLKAIGDAYLNLLYKHVLTCEHYLNNITPTAWEELLDTSISICMSKYSKLDSYTKLRLLLLVIKHANDTCQFIIPLRDYLPKMKLCFLEVASDKKVQHIVIDIMIILLQALSAESRLAMCEFTESLLSPLLKFYDQNLDQKKKASFFELFLCIVRLHHPLGKTKQESGSLAHNWDTWKKYMLSILEVVCLEVAYLQKLKKQTDTVVYNGYYSLAAAVYYQIFTLPEKSDQEEGENSTKRQRVSYNRNNSFCDLVEEMRLNHSPWLSVIQIYVTDYGESISTKDYVTLLSVAEGLITKSTSLDTRDDLSIKEMVCQIVKNLTTRSAFKDEGANIVISLWNTCVRTSTLPTTHASVHSIMQLLLTLDVLKYQHVQLLIKLYYEKGMKVTNHSLKTLNHVFHNFFSKFCHKDAKMNCFSWLVQDQATVLALDDTREFLLRLLVNENVGLHSPSTLKSDCGDLYNILFSSPEKSILFSQFELDLPDSPSPSVQNEQQFELNVDLNREIKEYFQIKLSEKIHQLNNKELNLLDFMSFLKVILCYLDIMLKNNLADRKEIEGDTIFRTLKTGVQDMYSSLTIILKNNGELGQQTRLLRSLKGILIYDYDNLLNAEVRRTQTEFFECMNIIINRKITSEEIVVYSEDDSVLDPQELRHECICTLAAYCRKRAVGRSEILNFILDPEIYNFTKSWDCNCAFECIELLNGPEIEESPLDLVFVLMQNMCKALFKDPQAAYKLLKIFLNIMDKIWNLEKEKQNCCIMVRGYLQRCEKKYYPPRVAALVYECVATMLALSLKQNEDLDKTLMEVLQNKVKNEVHNIRLYCSYLLKLVVVHLPNRDILTFLEDLTEIFMINVAERNEAVIKDELINRTVTVLHTALALVQTKNSLLQDIITQLIQIQKEKSLDKALIKKVLNTMTNMLANKDVELYFNDNVLFLLNFWFSKGYSLDSLPFHLFGCDALGFFLQQHYKWTISADILWGAGGVVTNSTVFNLVQAQSGKSAESVIETCISNIIALYIPYTVTDKYNLSYRPPGSREWAKNAEKVFQTTTEILGADKWSGLFAENLNELVVLAATHFTDHAAATQYYSVNIPLQTKSYIYPKVVFEGILNYMSEVIEEDVLKYLCESQALTIFKALYQLWANVLRERVFEFRVLSLHSFVAFLEMIPLNCPSDAFVGNFACTSLAHAIKDAKSKEDIKVFSKALKMVLEKYVPDRVQIVRKPVLQLLSILMIKRVEGFEAECAPLLSYLTGDVKEYLKEEEDVIDFISSLSQGVSGVLTCSSKIDFLEKLNTYKNNLSCPSHETLINMRDFLRLNKHYVTKLCDDFNKKGFSDDCGSSAIHQIICSLSKTLKSATDDKTLIEACNCLAEIGNYDLKTLVTIPPASTQRVTNIQPKQYFAIVVMTSLTEILFDKDPAVTNAVSKTLKRLLQYREGKVALDLEQTNKDILIPLSSSNCNVWADFVINEGKFKSLLCIRQFWVQQTGEKHSAWLTRITSAILEVLASSANYLSTLQAVCKLKPNICEKILPPLLGVLLECCPSENYVKAIAEITNTFFKNLWNLHETNKNHSSHDTDDSQNRKSLYAIDQDQKKIMQYMLDIVNFVRLQRGFYKARPDRTTESLNYLRLDYEKVAWVATVADQNMAALYYGELWAIAQNDGIPPASPEATTLLDGGDTVQRIFRKCFVSIGEMDAIDGCGTAHLTSEEEKRKHLMNTGQYNDALLLLDIALSCGGQVDPHLQYGVVKSLHKSGMHHFALQYIKSLPENESLNDIKYECLSFLGDWSDFVDTRDLEEKCKEPNCNTYPIIKAFRYSCLKDCLNIQPASEFDDKLTLPLNRAKRAVAKLCQNLNMENCQNIYKVLSKLHQFEDIKDYFSVRCEQVSIKDLLQQWRTENLPAFSDFKHLETLITQRSLILEHAAKDYRESLNDIVSLQLQYAELSLSNEKVQMAQRLIAVVKKVQNSQQIALAESQISWAKGHKDIALSLLRNIVSNPSPDERLTAISLRQYGIWMAESKRDNARDIINKYLKKSLELLSRSDHEETKLKVFYDIAKFADAEYKQVVAYMSSSVYEKKVKCLESIKSTANTMSTQPNLSKDERKAYHARDKFGNLEEAEIANTKAEKETFLQEAMRYYLLSLKQSENNNLSVFRVISLWLDNPGIRLPEAGESFEDLLHSIPSWKFISVLPQLAPRLTNERNFFADNLRRLLKRCALEHPHHTLPILFNLKNSDKDKMILSENVGKTSQQRSQEPRVTAAAAMVAELAAQDNRMARIVEQMEQMCDATISLANYVPKSKTPNQKQKIPAAEKIHKIGPLDAIPIPTVSVCVRVDCKYSYLPTIHGFENYFETVGGVNCPKKINCKGSDGRNRILLIKGEDDLRQDAVMQQVFNIVNTLLENDPVTSRNKLLIRTYKVVPMSKKSGVLEWCEGTVPIGFWLSKAHLSYRPKDISPSVARQKIIEYAGRSPQDKLMVFMKILRDLRPVFHYFFTESFHDPVTWYERRLAYTKSVASSSMIGYILGLGDRHVHNILIDKQTAEVVHIDFGIAFDQGKTLPTPETIPFRLTQDIVAGFGPSGVEGIFRRSCEKTMQLLRDNQETLLTILEVLLCDPLYSWTITSKQQNVSTSRDTSGNPSSSSDSSLAKRALLSVSSKLSGTEGGAAGGVAVQGQVARLIHCAMDPVNLSRLFHGWQAYL